MGSVAVFGAAGIVGSTVVRELAHVADVTSIHLFDVNEKAMQVEAVDAAAVAEKLRPESVNVQIHVTDMRNTDALAKALTDTSPDVLIQAATPRGWYSFPGLFDPEVWQRINHEGRMGPWLPLFVHLPAKLMQARQAAGLTMPVVQISYPDAVNSILDAVGLTPTCGSGNSQNIATILRLVAAQQLAIPVKEIDVQLVANHFHAWALAADDPEMTQRPMWMRIYAGNEDVTDTVTTEAFWADVRRIYPRQRPIFAASSAVQNAVRLLRDDRTAAHVTAPAGLPGGIQARLGANGAQIMFPDELSETEVRRLLTHAQKGDGIEAIFPDGSVQIAEQSAAVMRELMGYDCDVLHFDEIEARSDELIERLPSGKN
jgi:hypothetical protein